MHTTFAEETGSSLELPEVAAFCDQSALLLWNLLTLTSSLGPEVSDPGNSLESVEAEMDLSCQV
jgi:hypothetical protein